MDYLSKRLAFLLRVVFLHPELELTISEVTGHGGPNCCHGDVTGHFFVSTPHPSDPILVQVNFRYRDFNHKSSLQSENAFGILRSKMLFKLTAIMIYVTVVTRSQENAYSAY